MKPLLPPLTLLAFLLPACRSADISPGDAPWQGEIRSWGTLREALRDGRVQARVAVADVAAEGVWAVGALEGLAGEVTIADGEAWITEGDATSPLTTRSRDPAAEATVLFAVEVDRWQELPVDEPVDPSVFDAWLASRARAAGLDPAQPFPFVVEGELSNLRLHVIADACPIRARMLGESMTSPPYELFLPSTPGRLVGIYAPDSAGIVCHMGARSHVHVLLDGERPLTGHVETVGVASGATLRLPRR